MLLFFCLKFNGHFFKKRNGLGKEINNVFVDGGGQGIIGIAFVVILFVG